MKIDVTQSVLNYEGKPYMQPKVGLDGEVVKDKEGNLEQEEQPLRDVFVVALNSQTPEEQRTPRTHEQSMKIYRLTKRLYDNTHVQLSSDERTFLRDQLAKFYPPAVVGCVTDILFPEDVPPTGPKKEAE